MQHLDGSGTPVLYIGRTVLKRLRATMDVNNSVQNGPVILPSS